MKKNVCLFLGLMFLSSFFITETPVVQAMKTEGSKIIIFTANGFVYSEMSGVRSYLNYWGSNVTIAGLTETVTSAERTITADVVIADISITDITEYDAIFIPGGGLADALIGDAHTMELISVANNSGMVIAGICAGTLVIAAAGLVDGKHFATWPTIIDVLEEAGGIHVPGANIVTDGNIITGAPPNEKEMSYNIALALGYFYELETDVEGNLLAVFAKDFDVVDTIIVNISKKVTEIEREFIETINLTDNLFGNYTGTLSSLESGEYSIGFNITNIWGISKVQNNAYNFSIGMDSTSSTNSNTADLTINVLIVSVTLIAISKVFLRRRLK